jgi:hypothetical protein
MELSVHAVLVPPLKCGIAYAHTPDGRCVQFTGERYAMIALCDEVKSYNCGNRGPVHVHAVHWRDVRFVQQTDCPAHESSAA